MTAKSFCLTLVMLVLAASAATPASVAASRH